MAVAVAVAAARPRPTTYYLLDAFFLYKINGAKAKEKIRLTNWNAAGSKSSLNTGLQITVGHWTLANQNFLISDQSLTVVGRNSQTFFILNLLFM